MDKVMLVESLGYNLMSVSMLCDLDKVVIFGKYLCIVLMESDNSKVFGKYRIWQIPKIRHLHDLHMFSSVTSHEL